ncbi:hypothetical protein N7516_010232 [Penicillium verrucosum]|uniref:uncharacterized protein n=1 Tax=Penicillium verrucosum TaxID=60171 RepID=UPI002545505A|nr:uncharacterized protein N7516_010232 [Penicillium verrucosum]KAJ5922529.1 hypothetical protein N7516_010232 [Penicillium verrucosum]
MELVATLVVLVELTKELAMMIDNSITTESNHTSNKANTKSNTTTTRATPPSLVTSVTTPDTFNEDRNIDPGSLLEQIDLGILVAALASALPDRDGDIPMRDFDFIES